MAEGTVMTAIRPGHLPLPASWSSGSWLQATWNYPAPDRRRCPRSGLLTLCSPRHGHDRRLVAKPDQNQRR